MTRDLETSLAELATGLRTGQLTSETLIEAAIARHEQYGEQFDAYKLWQPEAARAVARAADLAFAIGAELGPLQGLPTSIKDLYAVDGLPTFAGTSRRLPPKFEQAGPIVTAVRRQQAAIMGKTHTVEFAFGGLGTNPHWGTPRNPWDAKTHRVPGGSSSGAGVSLQEGSAVLALGSDTAGSVRIPASFTGNVGLKTTYGRWPLDGIVPLSPSLDTPGVLARTVADAAYAFAALDPTADRDRPGEFGAGADITGLRIGMGEHFFWDDCAPGIVEGVKAGLDELSYAGARLVEFSLPEVDEVYQVFRRGGIAAAEFYTFLNAELPNHLEDLDPMVFQRMDAAAEMTATEYLERRWLIERSARSANARMATVDVVATPTVAITPPTVEEVSTLDGYKGTNLLALRNTCIANLLRMCAVSPACSPG